MNGLYAAAGRWLFDTWMRRGVLGLTSVSFYPSFKLNEPASGLPLTVTLLQPLQVFSNNGNALARAYGEIIRKNAPGEGMYQQYNDWLNTAYYLKSNFLEAYAEFMGGK